MNINQLISQMTTEEKCSLLSGLDFWHTKTVERLGIENIMVADGPHGLRKQEEGDDDKLVTIKATCFPSASALACSFDKELAEKVGFNIGEECLANGVDILLGPGVNIKRSPLCGRNFEYYSEDPVLAGKMAKHFIKGVQSNGVGTSIKHFAVNNQEFRRLSVDACLSKRALFEIYLTNFEIAIKEAAPYTVMCSYNKINGDYACESDFLLTDILRNVWGFDGVVVSDWGATNNRVNCLKAGMELEMPSSGGLNDTKVLNAVKSGELDEKYLDTAVERLLKLIEKCISGRKENFSCNMDAHHEIARQAARESAVLLKNNGSLPIKQCEKICILGIFAEVPRFQGGGSSHVNSQKIDTALDELKNQGVNFEYLQTFDCVNFDVDNDKIEKAIALAKTCDKTIVFAGLPDSFESEGYDRKDLDLPKNQNALINALCDANLDVSVVLQNGSPVVLPWKDKVCAILECYLAGEATSSACVDLLTGKFSPSGKLAETFPEMLCHNPSYLSFPGVLDKSVYTEDVFVGYRYYEKKAIKPAFCFGHGLSYSKFEYSNIKLSSKEISENGTLTVSADVTNTGCMDAKEVVLLFVGEENPSVIRPLKELKGFEKVFIKKGESVTVTFELDKRAFAYYDENSDCFAVKQGNFTIFVGSSCDDVRLTDKVFVKSDFKQKYEFHRNSTISDLMVNEKGRAIFEKFSVENSKAIDMMFNDMDDDGSDFKQQMMENSTLRSIVYFSQGLFSEEMLDAIVNELNA